MDTKAKSRLLLLTSVTLKHRKVEGKRLGESCHMSTKCGCVHPQTIWTFGYQVSRGYIWPLGEDTGESEARFPLLNPHTYEVKSVMACGLALQRKRHFLEGCGVMVKIRSGQPGSQRTARPTPSFWGRGRPMRGCRAKLDSLSQELPELSSSL